MGLSSSTSAHLVGLRFVEKLLAQRWGFGNGTSEVWRFLKTFGNLHNPCHLIVFGPQADVRLTSCTHTLYLSWVLFDPSHFAEVFRLLEVVEGIVSRAKLVVQLHERYRRLITRGMVALTFSPRNSTQVAGAMKTGQGSLIDFASMKRVPLREGLY